MILLCDLGNTRVRWASLIGRELGAHQEAYHQGAADFLSDWHRIPPPARVLLSSVAAPELGESIKRWVRAYWNLRVEPVESSRESLGVINGYRTSGSLGVDRWLALLAARELAPGIPVCVADFGTALTVDLLTAGGEHLGGAILPGRHLVRDALFVRTAGVRTSGSAALPRVAVGRDTDEAIDVGILEAAAGLIERCAAHLADTAGGEPVCYLTGGDGELMLKRLHLACEYRPHLVLEGLARIARANS